MSKRIEVTQVIKSIKGEPVKGVDPEKPEEELTLKTILVNALLNPANENEKTTGENKVQRFNLAQTIYGSEGFAEIANSDIAMIKTLVNNVYPAMIVAPVWGMLDDAQEG